MKNLFVEMIEAVRDRNAQVKLELGQNRANLVAAGRRASFHEQFLHSCRPFPYTIEKEDGRT